MSHTPRHTPPPPSQPIDVVNAIRSANKVFSLWQKASLEKRRRALNVLAQTLVENSEELSALSAQTLGTPIKIARHKDVGRAIELARAYAAHQESLIDQERAPIGAIGVVTGWSFSILQMVRALAPALYCGNTLVIKPSSRASALAAVFASRLADNFAKAELPTDLCQFVYGPGVEIAGLLAAHPGLRALSFFGKADVAPGLLAQTAPQLKRVQLHLSAKNSALILEDADLDQAAAALAPACFEAAGQSPYSIARVMVSEKLHDEFVSKLDEAANSIKIGDPSEATTDMGPMVSAAARDHAQKLIDQAVSEGAKAIKQNKFISKISGPYLEPTILVDLNNCSSLQQEEFYAPVVLILPYKAVHEGIKWLNTTPYGQAASIWSQDLKRARTLASLLDVGRVWLNSWDDWSSASAEAGFKLSYLGSGSDLNAKLDFFSQIRFIRAPGPGLPVPPE